MNPRLGSWLSLLGGLIILALSAFIIINGIAGFSSDDYSRDVRGVAKGFHFIFTVLGFVLLVMSIVSVLISLGSVFKRISPWAMIFGILTGLLSLLPALIFIWPAIGSLLLIVGGIMVILRRNH